jgi:hypothetical protein
VPHVRLQHAQHPRQRSGRRRNDRTWAPSGQGRSSITLRRSRTDDEELTSGRAGSGAQPRQTWLTAPVCHCLPGHADSHILCGCCPSRASPRAGLLSARDEFRCELPICRGRDHLGC